MPPSSKQIHDALATVKFPGLSRDIVSFGLVEDLEVENGVVRIRLSVPSGSNHAIEQMARDAHGAVSGLDGVDEVQLDISAPRAAAPGPSGGRSRGFRTCRSGRPWRLSQGFSVVRS